MLRRFISYYKPHRKMFFLDMTAAFFVAVCDVFYPIITRNILNDFIPNQKLSFLIAAIVALLTIYTIKMGLQYFVQYYGHLVGVNMQADMRKEVFTHLQKLPFSFYDEHATGTIMSRMINDLMDVSELAHHGPEDLFISGSMMIFSFLYLSTISFELTLIIFAFIPILIFFAVKMRKRMSDAFTESRVKIADVNANLTNSISGIRVSKAFANSDYEVDKFQKGNNAFRLARKKAYKAMAQFHSGTTYIIDLLNVVMLLSGGYFTYQGIITFADFVTYMLFIGTFISPIKRLINFMEQLQSGMTGFKRFTELMDQKPEPENGNAISLSGVEGHIVFDNVSFTYGDGKEVLKNINLDIPSGKTIALVGPSGGGKTTICHLVPHFYPLDTGSITIDGINIKDIKYESLRSNIGIVQQDVFLFHGTIKENIAYGDLNASDEEIIEAAKKANIHEFVMSLEEGYETNIGERGVKLSGGQKQRLSIARVFLKNPKILILDEATSALDNTTEVLIQEALNALSKNRTTLVVAHRLSTIKNADEIIVITGEGIEERGTHDALLAKGGTYAALYQSQFQN